MRSYNKDSEYDVQDMERLNVEPWMLGLLELNPGYVYWGPYEDYMFKRGRDEGPDGLGRTHDHGWEARMLYKNWSEFDLTLDELNECVNFYFEIGRDSKDCPVCGGIGYSPDAQWVSESFYTHSSPFKQQTQEERNAETLMASFGGSYGPQCGHAKGPYPTVETMNRYGKEFQKFCEQMRLGEGWGKLPLTEDEIKALTDAGRQYPPGRIGHDGINRGILIRARCERFGIETSCSECEGHGHVFTEDKAHMSLVLWILHPRKGASRGVHVKRIEKDNLPAIMKFLDDAAKQNAERFSRLVKQFAIETKG